MEYNEGDRVQVKVYRELMSVSNGDEAEDLFINGVYFIEEMKIFCGKEATIRSKFITDRGRFAYKLSFDKHHKTRDWSFNAEMLDRGGIKIKPEMNEFNEELL